MNLNEPNKCGNEPCVSPPSLCVADIVVIISDSFLGHFVGNTLWLIAIGYYLYITFLGYNGKSCIQFTPPVVSK